MKGTFAYTAVAVLAALVGASCGGDSARQGGASGQAMDLRFVTALDLSRRFSPDAGRPYCITGWLEPGSLPEKGGELTLDGPSVLMITLSSGLALGRSEEYHVRIQGTLSDPGVDFFGPDRFDGELLAPAVTGARYYVRVYGPMRRENSGEGATYWMRPHLVEVIRASDQHTGRDWGNWLGTIRDSQAKGSQVLTAEFLLAMLAVEEMGVEYAPGVPLSVHLVIAGSPERLAALKYLALIAIWRHEYSVGIDCLKRILTSEEGAMPAPGFSRAAALYLLGRCYFCSGDDGAGVEVWNEVMSTYPDSVYADLARARDPQSKSP